jgi:tungstate transport system ATP-binding protein
MLMPNANVAPLSVKNLSLRIGDKTLLKEINLTSSTPGISMIMGANGAGKSLLLRSLHGLLDINSGEIHFSGSAAKESRAKQAMVFQKPVLLRRSTLQNLKFAAPKDTDEKTLFEYLGLVHLDDKANSPARMLSGGEQQRLALARALITQPEVLLLDEPTASLDPASVLIIEKLIKSASQNGVKVIFVSHDIGQAKRLASDVIFLHKGEVTEHAEANTFFTNPESREAKAYLAGELLI